jgi:hypothetical protein
VRKTGVPLRINDHDFAIEHDSAGSWIVATWVDVFRRRPFLNKQVTHRIEHQNIGCPMRQSFRTHFLSRCFANEIVVPIHYRNDFVCRSHVINNLPKMTLVSLSMTPKVSVSVTARSASNILLRPARFSSK